MASSPGKNYPSRDTGVPRPTAESQSASALGLRDLHVLVVLPRDRDADLVLQQLTRLGCQYQHVWPLPDHLPQSLDIVISSISEETRSLAMSLTDKPQIVLVGIVDPSLGHVLQLLGDMNPLTVLSRPLSGAAVLSGLVVARNAGRYQRRLLTKIAKLEETLRSVRKVERAKAILMQKRHIDESTAYTLLREQAMQKRVPIGVIANAVVESHEVLQASTD
jgi:AmiR/NasT family two-component response regulator